MSRRAMRTIGLKDIFVLLAARIVEFYFHLRGFNSICILLGGMAKKSWPGTSLASISTSINQKQRFH